MVQRRGDLGGVNALLRGIVKAIESQKNDIIIVVLKDVEGAYKQRIFNNGLATNLTPIGKYSTKDMLIGASTFDRDKVPKDSPNANTFFGTKKKRSKLEWVTVKGRRLAVLKGGYAKFRRLFGRKTDKVDLEFTSEMRKSIQIGTNAGTPVLGFVDDFQKLKSEGNEKRFKKKIFTVSKTEEDIIDQSIDREITRIVQRIVRSV